MGWKRKAVPSGGLSHKGQELVLLGGCNHRTGGNDGGRYDRLREDARRFWPECREEAAWSAQDCMTLDGIPLDVFLRRRRNGMWRRDSANGA